MIAIFYTGDVRHNQNTAMQNHQLLFDKLQKIIPFNIYHFTRDDAQRGLCPYDPPTDIEDPDNRYRRGQGGAVQVWDFMRGVQRTTEEYVMKLRTDVWFTESAVDTICFEIQEMLAQRSDIAYFGSDWINENAGKINDRLPIHIDFDNSIQDFVVLARRSKLKSFDNVINDLDTLNPNKRRSGNKTFRYIIPAEHGTGMRTQLATVYRTLCQIWLIRQNYDQYPTDMQVCKDYIQSYIADDKAKMGKKNLIYPHPMQGAVDWWRSQQGWDFVEIQEGRWHDWHTDPNAIHKENYSIDVFHNATVLGQHVSRKKQRHMLLARAMESSRITGTVCEFGVHQAQTLVRISSFFESETVFGFDSFQGLPETWHLTSAGDTNEAGYFAVDQLPTVAPNVKLVQGWFNESIPVWQQQHPGPVKFIHIDCDLYSSTKTVLTLLNNQIVPGTVIVFDEMYNWARPPHYDLWHEGEYKALKEWLEEFDRTFKVLFRNNYFQCAIKVLS